MQKAWGDNLVNAIMKVQEESMYCSVDVEHTA